MSCRSSRPVDGIALRALDHPPLIARTMEFLEVPLFDDDIYKLLVRFLLNLFFLSLLVRCAIHPNQSERAFAFTAVMMNVTVFFICFSLKKLELGLGMALGLFAIFGVLRYRTDAIRTKEMTYLFIVIGLAVINALSNHKTSYIELFAVNFSIIGAAMLKEAMLGKAADAEEARAAAEARDVADTRDAAEARNAADAAEGGPPVVKGGKDRKKQRKYAVEYDKLEWLGPEHESRLIDDLRARTGIDVQRVQVQNIDLRNRCASLTVWSSEGRGETANDEDA
jgi:hypothetical protein